jgi:hypothetical protein
MKVVNPPLLFVEGDDLDPQDLNAVFAYADDAYMDATSRRYQRASAVLVFASNVASPYTEASSAALRTFKFRPPVDLVVERAFLRGTITSSAAVTIELEDSVAGHPVGASTPYLTTGAAVTAGAVSDNNQGRVFLEAGETYSVRVEGAGTFSCTRLEVELHFLVDRWGAVGPTVPIIDVFNDASAPDAIVVTDNVDELDDRTDSLAANVAAAVPVFYVLHGFTSATDADLLTFALPRFDEDRAQCKIVAASLCVLMSGTGGGTVTATIKNTSGVAQQTLSCNVAGVTEQEDHDVGLSISLTTSTAGASALPAQDFSLEFANSSAGTTCLKATAILWVSR